MVVSLGTSGTLFGKSSVPILDPSGAVAPFCDATGAWLPLLCTLNCTKVLEEVRVCFCAWWWGGGGAGSRDAQRHALGSMSTWISQSLYTK